jgi:hypothetical protein
MASGVLLLTRQGGTHAVAVACPSGASATAPTPRESREWQHRGRGASTSPPRVRGHGGAGEGPAVLRRIEPTQHKHVCRQHRIRPLSLILDYYELQCQWKVIEGFGADLWGNQGCMLQYLRCYSTRDYCSCPGLWRRLGWRGSRNAGRGASPTASKREGFSF